MTRNSGSRNPTEALDLIANELQTQYQIELSRESGVGRQKWRKIKATAWRNDESGKQIHLSVRTREGFYR